MKGCEYGREMEAEGFNTEGRVVAGSVSWGGCNRCRARPIGKVAKESTFCTPALVVIEVIIYIYPAGGDGLSMGWMQQM